jgi:hypothetical protein
VNVLPFGRQNGRVFGILKAELEECGIGCSEPDLRIAVVTIQHRSKPSNSLIGVSTKWSSRCDILNNNNKLTILYRVVYATRGLTMG